MKIISIIIGKMTLLVCKLLGRGSAFPGTITYKLNKNILKEFKKPNLVIAVTGSSGKGSTTKMIAEVLKKQGFKVAYNDKDSNERSAIITTLLENSTLTGRPKVNACVFEMDERYAKYVFKDFRPDYVVITNITRDQPPRQGHYDFVYEEILKALDPKTELILNADDPYLQKFALLKNFKITYYGINKLKYSYKKNIFEVLNISHCLKCQHKLAYNYYQIEYLGDYYCKNCDFKRPKVDYAVTDFDYDKQVITINKRYKIKMNSDILFSLYNTVAAFAALKLCKIENSFICDVISNMNRNKKLYDNYSYNSRDVYVLNNKNENATTFNQALLYSTRKKNLKTFVIGWWQISRRYPYDDLSWLYDIEFELLKNEKIDTIIVAGPQKYDLKVRLKYAGINPDKIKCFDNLYAAKKAITDSKGDIYAVLNFDYVGPFKKITEVKK